MVSYNHNGRIPNWWLYIHSNIAEIQSAVICDIWELDNAGGHVYILYFVTDDISWYLNLFPFIQYYNNNLSLFVLIKIIINSLPFKLAQIKFLVTFEMLACQYMLLKYLKVLISLLILPHHPQLVHNHTLIHHPHQTNRVAHLPHLLSELD